MSLILEALKKSEQQRQREKAPNLQSIHQPITTAEKKSSKPLWLLIALIVICNVAFFGYWYFRELRVVVPVAQVAKDAVVESVANSETPAAPVTQQGAESVPQSEFTQITPRGSQPQTMPAEPAQRIEEINELPDSVRNNLPAMTFSFHVYSESPEQRTIIINDRRMREGDEVSAGLKLQNITQDGVVLLFEQHRIHISVLSDW